MGIHERPVLFGNLLEVCNRERVRQKFCTIIIVHKQHAKENCNSCNE